MKTNDLSYCTYLTVYSGNKLPPFYIGSTSIKNINNNYHGSVIGKKYKATWNLELKENPQYFHTKIITTHSDRKGAYTKELFFQESLKVVESPLYINMSYARKNGGFGNPTEETRKKISIANKGKKGRKQTEATKKKLSDINKGKKLTEEHRKKMSDANKGKKKSEETKAKMSNAHKIKPRTEEHIRKLLEVNTGNTYNLGRKHTKETRVKMSHAKIGKKHTEESKLKMSLVRTGEKRTEETKKKISESKTGNTYWAGQHHTEESKKKLSDVNKGKRRVYLDDGSYTYRYKEVST